MNKKKKQYRPWLTSSEVERSTQELKEICKSWGPETWEAYLKWYEMSFREVLVKTEHYEILGERVSQSIFELYGYDTCPKLQSFCEQILSTLTPVQEIALRSTYLHGKTVRQIAYETKRSHVSVIQNKYRAIQVLRNRFSGDDLTAQHLMKGAMFFDPANNNSIWKTNNLAPLKSNRIYNPENYDKELLNHPIEEVRCFFRAHSLRVRQYVYLRYWCGFSINEIARKCAVGVNTVDQVIEATVFKFKSALINPELITQANVA